jgi:hypothetical protein
MLHRCNLLALVGGGANPRYPPNKVMIWDDHQSRCIGELVFKTAVTAVKLRRDRIVVALPSKVYVYRFSDLKLLDNIATIVNNKGILSICYAPSVFVLATLGETLGEAFVKHFDQPHEIRIQVIYSSR